MKRYVFFVTVIALILTLSLSAIEEGDYGYYDVNFDGKIEITDVLGTLEQILNNNDAGGLRRVIQTLKLVSNGKIISPVITAFDENGNVSLSLYRSSDTVKFTLPCSKIGFDERIDKKFYLDGKVTMTVSADFETKEDVDKICAAAATFRYDTTVFEVEGTTVNPSLLAEKLEATCEIIDALAYFTTIDGKNATVKVEGDGNVLLDVATLLGAEVKFDEKENKSIVVKQFLPTVIITDATCTAGDEVELTVSLTHNPGIAGLQIDIRYAADVLTYVSGTTVSNGMYAQVSTTEGANPAKIVMANLSLKNIAGNMTLANLKFKISEDAAVGTYPILFENVQLYDKDIYGLRMSFKTCHITVEE